MVITTIRRYSVHCTEYCSTLQNTQITALRSCAEPVPHSFRHGTSGGLAHALQSADHPSHLQCVQCGRGLALLRSLCGDRARAAQGALDCWHCARSRRQHRACRRRATLADSAPVGLPPASCLQACVLLGTPQASARLLPPHSRGCD